jgi:hypothetical protein
MGFRVERSQKRGSEGQETVQSATGFTRATEDTLKRSDSVSMEAGNKGETHPAQSQISVRCA